MPTIGYYRNCECLIFERLGALGGGVGWRGTQQRPAPAQCAASQRSKLRRSGPGGKAFYLMTSGPAAAPGRGGRGAATPLINGCSAMLEL